MDNNLTNNDEIYSFDIVTYNDKIKNPILIQLKNILKNSYNTTNVSVFKLPKNLSIEQIKDSGYDKDTLTYPIAVASMQTSHKFATIDKIYVGREYRRKGIGSTIMEVCEDLALALGYDTIYANKHYPNDCKEIDLVKNHYNNTPFLKDFLDNLLGKQTPKGNRKSNVKFLAMNGYHADLDPYSFPTKYTLRNHGYIKDNNHQNSDIVRINPDTITEFIDKHNSTLDVYNENENI